MPNFVRKACPTNGYYYRRGLRQGDGDKLFARLVKALWLLDTANQRHLTYVPDVVKPRVDAKVAKVQAADSHKSPFDINSMIPKV